MREGAERLSAIAGQPLRAIAYPQCLGDLRIAAAAAEVIGAGVAHRADEAGRSMGAMRVELGGLITVRAGHAGAFVSVFFCARCCSTALAAILWARARILNSLDVIGNKDFATFPVAAYGSELGGCAIQRPLP